MNQVSLISPGGTGGWRRNERALSESLDRLGIHHEVRTARPRRGRRAMAAWPVGALLVAAAGRREAIRAVGEGARALVMVNSTSALLLPWRRLERAGVPVAIRIDSPASELWPGAAHALTHRLERRALARAAVAIATGERSAELVRPLARECVVAPVPVQTPGAATGERRADGPVPAGTVPYALAYAGQPHERGLDRLCAGWAAASGATSGAELIVTGIDPGHARSFLASKGLAEPGGVRWAGELPRLEYESLLAGASAWISVPRMEGHGIAALEALAAGVPLVCGPARGANEAEPIARKLDPRLAVAEPDRPAGLADAIGAALALTDDERARYSAGAVPAVAGHSRDAADAGLARAVRAMGLSDGG